MRFVKPLDTELLDSLATTHDLLITLEENAIPGGAGAGVLEYLSDRDSTTTVKIIGLPDEFVDHDSHEELLAYCKLDEAGLLEHINLPIEEQGSLREVS